MYAEPLNSLTVCSSAVTGQGGSMAKKGKSGGSYFPNAATNHYIKSSFFPFTAKDKQTQTSAFQPINYIYSIAIHQLVQSISILQLTKRRQTTQENAAETPAQAATAAEAIRLLHPEPIHK